MDGERIPDGSGSSSLTTYVSIGLERNSRSVNATAKASVWLTSPPDLQAHGEAVANALVQAIAIADAGAKAFEQLASEAHDDDAVDQIKQAVHAVCQAIVGGRITVTANPSQESFSSRSEE